MQKFQELVKTIDHSPSFASRTKQPHTNQINLTKKEYSYFFTEFEQIINSGNESRALSFSMEYRNFRRTPAHTDKNEISKI